MAAANPSEGICIVESTTYNISSHRILCLSSKNAAAPRKYHPEEVKGTIFKISDEVSQSGFWIQFQSDSKHSVRHRMESRQVKTEKGEALYFQHWARQRTISSCQVCPRSVSECFKTKGTGAGWFLKYFTACGENLLWILKVFPTCAASEDSS